jgi:Cof subfamily protein (haloacid dehalogenase superfamily)
VLDLDGTVLNAEKRISPAVAAAVAGVREAGLTVVLCTGRMVRSSAGYWRELGLNTPLIAYNGAMITDVRDGRVLFHRPLDLTTTLEVAGFGREIGLNFQAYEDDEMFAERDGEGVREYSRIYDVPYRVVDSFRNCLRAGATKLLAACRREEMPGYLARLRERFGPRLMLTESEGRHIEVCHPCVNKAAATQLVVERAGGRREQVAAVGDGMNDVEMLRWAGLGAAMGNASDRVKQAADVVIGSNAEDGLADFLKALTDGGRRGDMRYKGKQKETSI